MLQNMLKFRKMPQKKIIDWELNYYFYEVFSKNFRLGRELLRAS